MKHNHPVSCCEIVQACATPQGVRALRWRMPVRHGPGRLMNGVLFGVILLTPFMAMGQKVLMQWDFDHLTNHTCVEPETTIADAIEGNFAQAPGVVGKGLRLDGFTTRVIRKADDLQNPGKDFTVEAWVALGEYPWNWCPVLTTESGETKGYRLTIGPMGQVSMELAIGEQWICCTSAEEAMPLRKWMHLLGVCRGGKDMSLYVNGKQVATAPIQGVVTYDPKSRGILGMAAAAGKPSDIIRTWGTMSDYYGLEGIIDEIRVFDGELSPQQITERYSAVAVGTPDIPVHRLPVLEKHPGRFGAHYTKLKYFPGWDNTWPVDNDPDVVVCFDQSPVKLVFWRGTRYGPAWVSENENWMADQSVETWGVGKNDTEGCFEHMQDRHCRFSHVRIIENTAARAVVHWRYAPVSAHDTTWKPDEKTGWEGWVDEYYYIYPDASGIRKVSWTTGTIGPPVQYQESLPLLQPGQRKSDLLEQNYVTIGDYDFNQRPVPQDLPSHPADWPKNSTVQQFNFKSENKPFICFEPGNRMFVRYVAVGYNHFPVGQARCDGRWLRMLDRPSHVSSSPISDPVIHEQGNRGSWNGLYGMNRMSMNELIQFGRSWAYPAELSLIGSGFASRGYDTSQRCYQIEGNDAKSGSLEIGLQGSKNSPVINPAIRVKHWNSDGAKILVNGVPSDNCRMGISHGLDGTDLVLFVFINATAPVKISVAQ